MLESRLKGYNNVNSKVLGWNLTGKWEPCPDCCLAKMKQSKIPKTVKFKEEYIPGQLAIAIDISKGS